MSVSGGTPNLDHFLSGFTQEEIEGFKRFMRWISDNWDRLAARPDLARKLMASVFKDLLPNKSEEDLKQLFEALGKDAPGMPVLKLFNRRSSRGLRSPTFVFC